MKFSDIPLMQFGHTRQLSGAIYSGEGEDLVIPFPDEDLRAVSLVSMTPENWQDLLRQTDLLETEILAKAKDGTLTKAIFRKCTRQIEQSVSWDVFKRDGYCCRYCGKDGPLTVDHLVVFEVGGPSTRENLVSCCRKCNKTRGNQPYPEWLKSDFYLKVSQGLPAAVLALNDLIQSDLPKIPLKIHINSR